MKKVMVMILIAATHHVFAQRILQTSIIQSDTIIESSVVEDYDIKIEEIPAHNSMIVFDTISKKNNTLHTTKILKGEVFRTDDKNLEEVKVTIYMSEDADFIRKKYEKSSPANNEIILFYEYPKKTTGYHSPLMFSKAGKYLKDEARRSSMIKLNVAWVLEYRVIGHGNISGSRLLEALSEGID